jgi:type VI secretion system protein ImpA
MPLREDILSPIPGPSAAGTDLRGTPTFLAIGEALRQDDDMPQGEWQRVRKEADYDGAIRLAAEALATKSKDVEIATWLLEALVRRDGFAGMREGLTTIHGLMDRFWDGLHPQPEDGDLYYRAGRLERLNVGLRMPVQSVPLNAAGHDYLQYAESRAVGYEAQLNGDPA